MDVGDVMFAFKFHDVCGEFFCELAKPLRVIGKKFKRSFAVPSGFSRQGDAIELFQRIAANEEAF